MKLGLAGGERRAANAQESWGARVSRAASVITVQPYPSPAFFKHFFFSTCLRQTITVSSHTSQDPQPALKLV